jgi:hypothetical protein
VDIKTLQSEAWKNAEAHGFHENPNIPTSLLLIVQEVCEALGGILRTHLHIDLANTIVR